MTLIMDFFSEFEDLLRSYPLSRIAKYQQDYARKSSLLGKIASERLVEQEKVNKQLSEESKKLRRNFDLAQAADLDLEKKVAELAEALRQCQDGIKIAKEAHEQSKKDFEKLQKTHDNDLSLIENLHKDHDKSSKAVEDLRHNNSDLAKTSSSKEQQRAENLGY
jgi:chromosome segregation ATPase